MYLYVPVLKPFQIIDRQYSAGYDCEVADKKSVLAPGRQKDNNDETPLYEKHSSPRYATRRRLRGTLVRVRNTSYALTLTPTTGTISGTGILTLATAIPLTGPFSATEGGAINANSTNLVSLSFTMSNGTTFSTAHEDGQASAFFFNDGLLNLSFNRNSVNPSLGIGGTHFDFSTNGNFSGPAYSGGTVTFNSVAIVASPEPTSMLFIGTGLVAIASLRRRKASNS